MAATDRQDLHKLVDLISAGEIPAARKILRALSAQLDDEPETRGPFREHRAVYALWIHPSRTINS